MMYGDCFKNCDEQLETINTSLDQIDDIESDFTAGINETNNIVDVFENKRLIKKTVRNAPVDSIKVNVKTIVKVNLTGFITATRKIIENKERFEFVVGHGEVILGIDAAVALMHIGEVSEISIDPSYGFKELSWFSKGSNGCESITIPPNTHLTYLVEVLGVEPYPEPSMNSSDYDIDRIMHFCNRKRIWGNMWYTFGDFTTCTHLYTLACTSLKKLNYENISRVKQLYIQIANNLAITKMKMNQHSEVIDSLKYIVANDPTNLKGIYRLAQCYYNVGLLDECFEILTDSRKDGTTNILIEKFYLKIKEKIDRENERQKESYSKLFQSNNPLKQYISSTMHTFSTPPTSLNVSNKDEQMNVDITEHEEKQLKKTITNRPALKWAIIGGSIFMLLLSYVIFK